MKHSFFLALTACILFFSMTSCGHNISNTKTSDAIKISVKKAEVKKDWLNNHTQVWHPADKYICVIFGYGYNDKAFYDSTVEQFREKYGIEAEGGLIMPLLYPDDFKHGGTGRISLLPEIIKDKGIGGIILLGAPENTHNALADIRSSYGGNPPFPIFSFFPQDDILGMEYASDFVLENAQLPSDSTLPQEEQNQKLLKKVSSLLDSSIQYMAHVGIPLRHDENLHARVQTIVGNFGKISRYVDSESGLQSINHFVLD